MRKTWAENARSVKVELWYLRVLIKDERSRLYHAPADATDLVTSELTELPLGKTSLVWKLL